MAVNAFITKLVEECNRCEDITDLNTIKTIWFEDEPNASHQTPGARNCCIKPLVFGHQHDGSPLGPLGPTVLDITAILGTSPIGLSVDAAFAEYDFDLDLKTIFEERTIEVLTKWIKGCQKKKYRSCIKTASTITS